MLTKRGGIGWLVFLILIAIAFFIFVHLTKESYLPGYYPDPGWWGWG